MINVPACASSDTTTLKPSASTDGCWNEPAWVAEWSKGQHLLALPLLETPWGRKEQEIPQAFLNKCAGLLEAHTG